MGLGLGVPDFLLGLLGIRHGNLRRSRPRVRSLGAGLGFGVWGLGFGVWGLGFRVQGLGFRV